MKNLNLYFVVIALIFSSLFIGCGCGSNKKEATPVAIKRNIIPYSVIYEGIVGKSLDGYGNNMVILRDCKYTEFGDKNYPSTIDITCPGVYINELNSGDKIYFMKTRVTSWMVRSTNPVETSSVGVFLSTSKPSVDTTKTKLILYVE
ncbi:MAG: hypothetical protein WC099_01890 [Candidatus Paceibacterota bacterium]